VMSTSDILRGPMRRVLDNIQYYITLHYIKTFLVRSLLKEQAHYKT